MIKMWKKYRNKLSFPHFFHNVWKTLRKPVEKIRAKIIYIFIDENNQSAYNRDDVLLLIK